LGCLWFHSSGALISKTFVFLDKITKCRHRRDATLNHSRPTVPTGSRKTFPSFDSRSRTLPAPSRDAAMWIRSTRNMGTRLKEEEKTSIIETRAGEERRGLFVPRALSRAHPSAPSAGRRPAGGGPKPSGVCVCVCVRLEGIRFPTPLSPSLRDRPAARRIEQQARSIGEPAGIHNGGCRPTGGVLQLQPEPRPQITSFSFFFYCGVLKSVDRTSGATAPRAFDSCVFCGFHRMSHIK